MVKRYMQPHKHKIKHVTEDVDYHFVSQPRLQMFLLIDQLVMRDKTIYCVMCWTSDPVIFTEIFCFLFDFYNWNQDHLHQMVSKSF